MSSTRTLIQLRTRARQLAYQEESDLVSDDELNDIVNERCQELYDLLISVRGQDYYSAETSITSVSGQAVYSLPDDFYQLHIAMVSDGVRTVGMATFEEQEYPQLSDMEGSGSFSYYDVRYRLKQQGIEFRPAPNTTAWSFKLRYIPRFERLVNDSDTFDGINGWERYVEVAAAIDMVNKDESDAGPLLLELQRIEQRIRTLAPARDAGRPPRIVDTRGDWHDYYSDYDLS